MWEMIKVGGLAASQRRPGTFHSMTKARRADAEGTIGAPSIFTLAATKGLKHVSD
jgi:hypothetical protein